MTKIIDKIQSYRNDAAERQKKDAGGSCPLYYSLEFFPPKTKPGIDNLYQRIDRMINRIQPLFVDVTWGMNGSTAQKTLAVASYTQQKHSRYNNVDVLMHLTTTGMKRGQIVDILEQVKSNGIQNILALRGDPPKGKPKWQIDDISNGYCPRAIDLVKLIREVYGDEFGIAVAGHPEGHSSSRSMDEELYHLKEKVDAGADFIITQFFYDVDIFLSYVKKCRDIGIVCPIIPGIMPIQSYSTLIKMTQYCGVTVPDSIMARLKVINKNDDEAVKRVGCEIAAEMCSRIYSETDGDIDGVHFYTLNLERSAIEIVQLIQSVPSMGPLDEPSFDLSQKTCSPTLSSRERALPWSPTTDSQRFQEEVRPINWSNRPKSYAKRTEDWDEFPNGRWGDSTSPAFGELSDMSHFYSISVVSDDERRAMLGSNPTSPKDIYETFAKYVTGTISHIPWCETPLQPESFLIQPQLVKLNQAGFLTINSQPAVNGKPSTDKIFGWGSEGGFIYQKEYCECFCSRDHLKALVRVIENPPSMNLYAVNNWGEEVRSGTSPGGVTALTWGVFPNREIVQPTIFDPDAFIVWSEEAFSLWTSMWLNLYKPGTQSYNLIESFRDSYFLVAIIDNDYVSVRTNGSPLWEAMLNCVVEDSV